MKIVFVVGGSYKGFYINQINKLTDVDLLIFNQNIFYDLEYDCNLNYHNIVERELVLLNKKFNCPIVVYGRVVTEGVIDKSFIVCNGGRVKIIDKNTDIYLMIKNKLLLIGNKIYNTSNCFATISMMDKNCYNINKIKSNHFFICGQKCVTHLNRDKICRKFKKCSEFILKKNN